MGVFGCYFEFELFSICTCWVFERDVSIILDLVLLCLNPGGIFTLEDRETMMECRTQEIY
jgi:hypothetical protein